MARDQLESAAISASLSPVLNHKNQTNIYERKKLMKNMTTLGQVADQIDSMSRNCHDKVVQTADIAFMDLEHVSIAGETFPVQAIAQRSFAYRLGIPYQYLSRCPAEIQAYNMNHWIKEEPNPELFLRFDGEEVRALFTTKYQPVDNFEVLERLDSFGYGPDTPVQCCLDPEFMSLSIPDKEYAFKINKKDEHIPGISISNSEVGLASLSIAAFVLRLVCTNGMVRRTEISGKSYRHVSAKVLEDLPQTINMVRLDLDKQKSQFQISLQSPVEHPHAVIESFNRQYQLSQPEKEAVEWSIPMELGNSMFHVVNTFTRASQHPELSAESSYKLQRIGGNILDTVRN